MPDTDEVTHADVVTGASADALSDEIDVGADALDARANLNEIILSGKRYLKVDQTRYRHFLCQLYRKENVFSQTGLKWHKY